jgi:hypothetical protein
MSTCVSRVMRNSMPEMLDTGIGTFELPGALLDACRGCESYCFEGAFVPERRNSELAFAVEEMTWKTPA